MTHALDKARDAVANMTPQEAYESDLKITPTYHDGTARPSWERLSAIARWSWERNPTPR
jgi:hypothetical protein